MNPLEFLAGPEICMSIFSSKFTRKFQQAYSRLLCQSLLQNRRVSKDKVKNERESE